MNHINGPQYTHAEQASLSQFISRESPSADSPSCPSYRGFFVDLSAALFGWLSVIFALLTVGLLLWGIVKYRDLINRMEKELTDKVNDEFGKRLEEVIENEVKPRVNSIIEEQLKNTLDQAKIRIEKEIRETIQQSDLKDILIREVAAEIQKRLNTTPNEKVEPKEFE